MQQEVQETWRVAVWEEAEAGWSFVLRRWVKSSLTHRDKGSLAGYLGDRELEEEFGSVLLPRKSDLLSG